MEGVIFIVKKHYFEEIKADGKTREIRTNTLYWRRLLLDGGPQVAVFICGREVHKRLITNIELGKPENALGRRLTLEGLTMIDLGPATS